MPGAALWSCGLDIDTRSFSYTIVLDVRSDDVRSFLHAVRVARHRRTASCEAPVAAPSLPEHDAEQASDVDSAHALDIDSEPAQLPRPHCEHGDALPWLAAAALPCFVAQRPGPDTA